MRVLILVSIVLVAVSCVQRPSDRERHDPPADSVYFLTGLDYQPELRQADSLVILFFKRDSIETERYQQYFASTTSVEPDFIKSVLNSLDQPMQELSSIKPCKSDGKMYLYKKSNENPIQTIFFKTGNDSCSFNYYIVNGKFYYMPMTPGLDSSLDKINPLQ